VAGVAGAVFEDEHGRLRHAECGLGHFFVSLSLGDSVVAFC
jgi:hypothetical protein